MDFRGVQFAGVDIPVLSAVCSASTVLSISGIHLPTFIGYTNIALTTPLSSMINTFLTVTFGFTSFDIIPYLLAIAPFKSAIIGNGTTIPVFLYILSSHAKCEAILNLPIFLCLY